MKRKLTIIKLWPIKRKKIRNSSSQFILDNVRVLQQRESGGDRLIRNASVTPINVSELILEIRTGGDDLRGGNDNLNVSVLLEHGCHQSASCGYGNRSGRT
jgi:hypothetical protein